MVDTPKFDMILNILNPFSKETKKKRPKAKNCAAEAIPEIIIKKIFSELPVRTQTERRDFVLL